MNSSPTKILNRNIFELDVLRGIAVLLVMCFHFFKNFSFGWVGVDLFFVLSGFLITGKLVETVGSPRYFSTFYIKRVLRIVPLYYLVLIFFFILLPVFAASSLSGSMHQLLDHQAYYWTFSVNFIEARNGWPANITLIHFWSLACEMQFYLLWPFVILWINRSSKRRILLWIFIILAILFRVFAADYLSLHLVSKYVLLCSRIDAFAIGGLAYFYLSSTPTPGKKIPALLSITSFSLIILLCIFFNLNWHYTNQPVQWIGYTLNAICWAGFLIYYCSTRTKPFFLSNLLALVGKYSYAMYVFHLPIWIFLEKFLPGRPWLSVPAFMITFLLAYLSYHLYEKYFLRMKPVLQHAQG